MILGALVLVLAATVFVPQASAGCVIPRGLTICVSGDPTHGNAHACAATQVGPQPVSACADSTLDQCGGGVDVTVQHRTVPVFHFPCPGPV